MPEWGLNACLWPGREEEDALDGAKGWRWAAAEVLGGAGMAGQGPAAHREAACVVKYRKENTKCEGRCFTTGDKMLG